MIGIGSRDDNESRRRTVVEEELDVVDEHDIQLEEETTR